MKQNNKIKILKRVFAVALCLIAVLSCIVIAPSADDSTATAEDSSLSWNRESLTHLVGRTKADLNNGISVTNGYSGSISIVSRMTMRAMYDVGYRNDGTKIYKNKYFNIFNMYFETEYNDGVISKVITFRFDGVLCYEIRRTVDGSYNDIVVVDHESKSEFSWIAPNLYLTIQLWLDLSSITDATIINDTGLPVYFSAASADFFTLYSITRPHYYIEGFDDGYESGFTVGWENGDSYGYNNGYNNGYNKGYDEARKVYDTSNAWADMKNLIFAIFDAPFYVISYALNFNIFGINIAGTLIALISTALIVWILKIIIVKLF